VPLSEHHARLCAAHPGVRDEQTASVLGALSPTARRILKAAFRVLERDGYEALSLRRIAAEAGETRSLIAYHFENKAGLVTTLVDSLWHDADVALEQEVEGLAADPRGRLLALTGLHLRLAQQPGLYRTYFDLLPHILRDEEARSRLSRTYRSYRHIGELCLAPGVPGGTDPLALATLLLAIGEGIAVQTLLSGDEDEATAAFAVLERRVSSLLGLGALGRHPTSGKAVGRADPAGRVPAPTLGAEEPAAQLTPAATRVLQAALTLLNDEGPQALTAEALSRTSGEPTSSVFYHFGDKRGLVAAVVAASDDRFVQALVKATRPFATRGPRPANVADVMAKIFAQPGWMRTLFDVLPVVLRDEGLRDQEAAFVERRRRALVAFLERGGVPEPERRPLASLTLALTHGLAIQRLVDRRGTPVQAVIETWRALLALDPDDAQAPPDGH
jgi:AcrR family transcriptional regulator